MEVISPHKSAYIIKDVDLVSSETYLEKDLTQFWHTCRKHYPIAWHPYGDNGFWVISRHQDIVEIFRNNHDFQSTRGNLLDVLLHGGDPAGGKMLPLTDGEKHARCRRELLKAFHPTVLKQLHQRLALKIEQFIQQAITKDSCDVAQDIAPHIPLSAICDLLAVPDQDREKLLAYTSHALAKESLQDSDTDAMIARNEILLYFTAHIHRCQPGQGVLLDHILRLAQPPFNLTEEEIIYNCYSFMLGGDETTRLVIISIFKTLIEQPQLWQQLKQEPISLDTAIDEFIRYATPARCFGRTVVNEIDIHGQQLKAGDIVTLWIESANFDETVFENPGQLNLSRQPNRHLSFGFGPHFCIGAQLAKMELKALLTIMIKHIKTMEFVGDAKPIYSNTLSGYSHLPINLNGESRG